MAMKPVNTDTKHFLDAMSVPLIDPGLLSEIVATAGDLSLLLSADGRIASVMINPHHAAFGQLDNWVGQNFSAIVTEESREKFARRMDAIIRPGAKSLAVEINHAGLTLWEFPVR